MSNNTRTKMLVTIIVFLLITNVAMLIFFLFGNKPADRRSRNHESVGMYNSLKNEVGFSQQQLDQYQAMRKQQMAKVRPLFNEVRNAKKDFYGLIYSDNISDSLINADADSIAQKQKSLDLQMFDYFKNIRKICSSSQIQKYDSTLKKEVSRMVDKPSRNNSHKK